MAYFNSYYPTSVSGEPDAYPFLGQMSTTEGVDIGTFTNGWGMVEQPGPTVGSPAGLTASYGKRH